MYSNTIAGFFFRRSLTGIEPSLVTFEMLGKKSS
jgi:hypothetical protein